jgi:hypothetical protein
MFGSSGRRRSVDGKFRARYFLSTARHLNDMDEEKNCLSVFVNCELPNLRIIISIQETSFLQRLPNLVPFSPEWYKARI